MKRCVKVFLIVFALILLASAAQAKAAETVASGTCGESLTWEVDDEGLLTVRGEGSMGSFRWDGTSPGHYMSPWYGQSSLIRRVVLEEGVTSIANGAFYGFRNLAAVQIPSSVTRIGSSAFSECSGLRGLAIPDTVTEIEGYVFCNCDSLDRIAIPSGIETIGTRLFYACDNLTCVMIPKSVKTIEWGAFSYCENLSTVYYEGSDRDWRGVKVVYRLNENDYFESKSNTPLTNALKVYNCIFRKDAVYEKYPPYDYTEKSVRLLQYKGSRASFSVPSVVDEAPVKEIDAFAFCGCLSIKSVTVPDSVRTIGGNAFRGCANLGKFTAGGAVGDIGAYAFSGCEKLKTVTLAEGAGVIGDSAFSGCGNLSAFTVPENVNRIGDSAFAGCGKLKGEVALTRVNSIGGHAFDGCAGLTGLTISSSYLSAVGDAAFSGCSGLKSVTLPPSIRSMGADAFLDCTGLKGVYIRDLNDWCWIYFNGETSNPLWYGHTLYLNGEKVKEVTVPNTGESFGGYTFAGCTCLESAVLPEGVRSVEACTFAGCSRLREVTVPESLVNIGERAFDGCAALKEVPLPEGMMWIGSLAFRGCAGLTEMTIPDGVKEIGSGIFSGCVRLQSVTLPCTGGTGNFRGLFVQNAGEDLPESLKRVTVTGGAGGTWTFRDCAALTEITLTEGVTTIQPGVFAGCTALETLTLPFLEKDTGSGWMKLEDERPLACYFGTSYEEGTTRVSIEYYSGPGVILETHVFYVPDSLRRVTVTGENIGYGAFWGCSMLEEIRLPEGIETIDFYAFRDCTGLNGYSVPETVTLIRDNAFEGCTGLAHIEIPDSVTEIGANAFLGCTGLRDLTVPENVTAIGGRAFQYCDNLRCALFPVSLETVGAGAFHEMGLKEVFYPGSREEWERIVIEANNEALAGADVHCGVLRSGDWLYEEDGSGAAVLLQYTGAGEDLTIPAQIGGLPVSALGNYVFASCDGLKQVTVGENVTEIGSAAFSACPTLSGIAVDEKNPNYTAVKGALLDRKKTKLLDVPEGMTGSYVIPKSVAEIAPGALDGCRLRALTLPAGMTEVESGTFAHFSPVSLTFPVSLRWPVGEFPAETEEITLTGEGPTGDWPLASQYILPEYRAPWYMARESLKKVVVKDGVTEIGSFAFFNLSALEEVVLADSVTKIDPYAFYMCDALKTVRFPECLRDLGRYAFCRCPSLEEIRLPSTLLSLGECAFKACSSLRSAAVPGVYGDMSAVFEECGALTELRMCNGPASIGTAYSEMGAFYGCEQLKTIYIPRSVTRIEAGSFQGCENLRDVYYSGSAGDWSEVVIGADNDCLASASLHFEKDTAGKTKADLYGVSTDWDESGPICTVKVFCRSSGGANACLALYDEDGRMLDLTRKSVSAKHEGELSIPTKDGAYASVFAVDKKTGEPLTASMNIRLSPSDAR